MKKTLIALVLSALVCSAGAVDLPAVKILATGGTIAGVAQKASDVSNYKAGELAIQTLIDAVPAIKEVADVSGEQIVKISSNNMDDPTLLKLAKRCNELLKDPAVAGIVITHGTDTMEETAYFLNLTVKSDKPVVLVGAMRPATAISADGPLNLLNAVKIAADPKAKDRGVLVVLNDEINAAREVTKTSTTNVSTFRTPEFGALGFVAGGEPYFYRKVEKKHTHQTSFDVSSIEKLPVVEIIYSHVNDSRVLTDAAVAAGAQGIVHAGTGNGSIYKVTEAALADAVKKGVTVVRSSRTGSGMVTKSMPRYTNQGFLEADNLNPQKARLLLQLALTQTKDPKKIQEILDTY